MRKFKVRLAEEAKASRAEAIITFANYREGRLGDPSRGGSLADAVPSAETPSDGATPEAAP